VRPRCFIPRYAITRILLSICIPERRCSGNVITIFSQIFLWIASVVRRCALLDSISHLRQIWKVIHAILHSISFTVFRVNDVKLISRHQKIIPRKVGDALRATLIATSHVCLVCIGDTRVNIAVSMIRMH